MAFTLARLLAPTDFSPTAAKSVEYAAGLAARFGASVKLLHAIGTGDYVRAIATASGGSAEESVHQLLSDETSALAQAAAALAQRFGIEVSAQIVDGPAPALICSVAESDQIDLIVIGSHGHSGLAKALLGSVAENVIRSSNVPVLTVRV